MIKNQPITVRFDQPKPVISVEFFPPKTEEGVWRIIQATESIKRAIQLDFVSITYGAGGTTQEKTRRYANLLKDEYNFQVMPHLTCVGASRQDLLDLVADYRRAGFCNIMALRGDPPKGETAFKPHPDGLQYAVDLVRLIKEHYPEFCLGVAGYPEKHPEAPTMESDLRFLKEKVDAGASFITTQLFFDNRHYFRFVRQCREAGINVPILPGIMPPLSLPQVERFSSVCGSELPDELVSRLSACGEDKQAVSEVGVNWAFEQVVGLIEGGAPGIHLYIMNRRNPALQLIERLQQSNILS